MKSKKRLLLPLVMLFTLLMAVSAFAKPKLSTSTVTFYKFESPAFSYENGKTSMTKKDVHYYADFDAIVVSGVSKNAKASISSGQFEAEGAYQNWPGAYYKGKYTVSVNVAGGYDPLAVATVKPGKYSATLNIKDQGKTYPFKITIIVKDYLRQCISYLKVGNKTFRSEFKKKNAGYITMKLPTGRQKITYACPKGFDATSRCGFYIVRNGKQIGYYNYGSTVTLKKGDILALGYHWKTWGKTDSFYIKLN